MISLLERLRHEVETLFHKSSYYEACKTPEAREAFLDAYINNTSLTELLGLFDQSFERTKRDRTTSVLETIEVLFQERLMEKTGWGRNDVMTAYKEVIIKALMNHE